MTQRMNRLPPQMRALVADQISTLGPHGVVSIATVMDYVRSSCSDSVPDRQLEDAIAEEAVSAGLAVDFNYPSEAECPPPVEQNDAREGAQ